MQKNTVRSGRLGNPLTNPKVVPYVFVAPFILFFLLVYLYPLIMTVIMSFQQIDGPNHHEFIGLRNYLKLNTRDARPEP